MRSIERALSARTILMTKRNLVSSLAWLRAIGLDAPDFPERCFFRRAGAVGYGIAAGKDMTAEVYARTADFGLIGSDKYDELPPSSGLQFEPLGKLACRFAFFVPQAAAWYPSKPCSVATSNPNALSAFAAGAGICLGAVVVKEGKVERAPASGETDAGFDLVETGASLAANNLRIVRQGRQVMLGGLWRGADEGSGVY